MFTVMNNHTLLIADFFFPGSVSTLRPPRHARPLCPTTAARTGREVAQEDDSVCRGVGPERALPTRGRAVRRPCAPGISRLDNGRRVRLARPQVVPRAPLSHSAAGGGRRRIRGFAQWRRGMKITH